MYYLTSITQVKEAVRKRRKDRDIVRKIMNLNIEKQFGISNFDQVVLSKVSESALGGIINPENDCAYGVLARQIPGICSEDLACYFLSLKLGLAPCSLAFSRDTFHSSSNDKLFRVKVPYIEWSKKGNLVINYESLISEKPNIPYTNWDMVRQDKIMTHGKTLASYHHGMQKDVCSHFKTPYIWGDVSTMWGEILAQAKSAGKSPTTVWRSGSDNKDFISTETYTEEEARSLVVRPSSKWYYQIYLSMFLDGTFVLLETYDNESGGVPEARRLFEKEMDAIYQATGYMPLVVRTYPLRHDMLYVNRHIIEKPDEAFQSLNGANYWSDDTCSLTRWLADQVVQVGRI